MLDCGCPKLLVVDDNDSNVFVIQNYCRMLRLATDVVSISCPKPWM